MSTERAQSCPHAVDDEAVLAAFRVSPLSGLTSAEVTAQAAKHGENKLPAPARESLFRALLKQFSSPLVLTLLAACAVSVFVALRERQGGIAKFGDAIAILFIVILNAILGLVQERKADAAVEALGKMAVPKARVLRDGSWREVSSEVLVPGDIIEVEAGDAIPADARLLDARGVLVEESALTGESVPVTKESSAKCDPEAPLAERSNMLFLGTMLVAGHARAVVTAIGPASELGRIGGLLLGAQRDPTPLEATLEVFGRRVLWGCLVVSAILFGWGLLRPSVFPGSVPEPWHQLLLQAVSLAVAAIPEGLPAITTITLALGTQRMAQRGALVRKLPAVETLGAATFVCTDKTGTLTQNSMMVRRIWTLGGVWEADGLGYDPEGAVRCIEGSGMPDERLLKALVLCNHAQLERADGRWRALGDPMEAALLVLARRAGLDTEAMRATHPRIDELPFDSQRRRMTLVTRTAEGEAQAWVKGSLDVVLARCSRVLGAADADGISDATRVAIEQQAEAMAAGGLRVLAVAVGHGVGAACEEGLTFLGLVGLLDPLRPGVIEAVAACDAAGIKVSMITGDAPSTAAAIARELGLLRKQDGVLTGAQLDGLNDEQLANRIESVRVFARATPEHKLRIVRALKRRGHVVAMTGDGVNDAPALREAHIGVAMGQGGTEVARRAADVVLADDNFATIVDAIREGRVIYRNIRKFIFFLLSANAGLCGAVFLAALIEDWPPFSPLMLLWINLVTNGLPALALGVDLPEEDVMKMAPRRVNEPLLGSWDWASMGVVGGLMTLGSAVFHIHPAEPPELMLRARALAFSYLALGALLYAYCCTVEGPLWKAKNLLARPLTPAVLVSAAVHAVALVIPALRPIFLTYPLEEGEAVRLVLLCLSIVPLFEAWKGLKRRLQARVYPERPSPAAS